MMVMNYAKQGSLRKLLDSKYNDLNWNSKIVNLYYIADGLKSIHQARLVHQDFHSGNIVNQNMLDPYITDFGLCKPVSHGSNSKEFFGVLPYIAPEVLYTNGKEYTQKSDIYSFGIIMSEFFTGHPPYYDIPHDGDLAMRICLGRRPEIECKVPQLLLDLMKKCLDAEPQNRPTAENLFNTLNRFFKDLKKTNTELYKQVEEVENLAKNSPIHNQNRLTQLNYQTHKQATYASRRLNFPKLPKPVNAGNSYLSFQ